MKTFHFNTGVQPHKHNPSVKIHKGQIFRGGTIQITFDCDNVPDKAEFKFACDNPELRESKYENWIVREIFNSMLCSKYAYFIIYS